MTGVFVDTSAWYALVNRVDRDHDAVTALIRQHRPELTTSNFVLDETLTLIRYRMGWQAAHAFGTRIRAGQLGLQLHVTPSDEDAAWATFARYRDRRLSFTDCTSFALMHRLRLSVAIATDGDFRAFGLHCLP